MLSIGKLGPGSEDYYLREVAGPEACYLGAGEAPGYWLGSALAELGLSAEVLGGRLVGGPSPGPTVDSSPPGGHRPLSFEASCSDRRGIVQRLERPRVAGTLKGPLCHWPEPSAWQSSRSESAMSRGESYLDRTTS